MKRKPSSDPPGAPTDKQTKSSSSARTSSPSRSAYVMSDRGRSPDVSGPPGSRHGSQSPRPPPGSRSPSRAPAGQPGWAPPMGHDPAKPLEPERKFNRVELPADAYALDRPDFFAARPKVAINVGTVAPIEVNTYRVLKMDLNRKIHQYDVSLSPSPSKPVPILKKIWKAPKFVAAFPPDVHEKFIFDGRKLAWSGTLIPRGELRVAVDLDEGKPEPGKGGESKFYIILRHTTTVNMAVLDAYLSHKVAFNNTVLEAMNAFDHILRQWPSERLLSIKRNFYDPQQPGRPLMDGSVVEVRKGAYWSARISAAPGSVGLAINADVANTAFFVGNQSFVDLAINFLATQDRRLRGLSPVRLEQELRPVLIRDSYVASEAFKQLKKLSKLRFRVKHANRPAHLNDPIGAESFTYDARCGAEGMHARNTTFTGHDGKTVSVEQYFLQKYGARLRFPTLPLIKTGRGNFIPMEFAILEPMQRYPFKLNPEQTSSMIKIAVNRPRERRAEIERGVAMLQPQNDPFLKHFGVVLDTRFTKTEGRVLPPPTIYFRDGGKIDPKFSGRWMIQGKKFYKGPQVPLDSWGFLVLQNCVNKDSLKRFADAFTKIFREHGGKCDKEPMLLNAPGNISNNAAEAVQWAHEQITARYGYPRLLFVIVPRRGDPQYERIKKSLDCRQGVCSQVLAAQHVQAAQGQYISNVCLKVNAKLGGATAITQPPWKSASKTYFPADRPTMIVGCDISHSAPGAPNASVAAMTMNVDPDANRFAAAVQTNGRRTEMLTQDNCQSLFGQLANYWKAGHPNQFPKHVIYMRDGVSEGEFAKVLDVEVAQFKAWFTQNGPPKAAMPRFTVLVATKRHHIRLFPARGDKNQNALPGTLVERDVSSPRLWDFFLVGHCAIQGTARPAHYHVLKEEMGIPPAELARMLYEQVYTYVRATTPVSIHPAIYYAHLAGSRARQHENIATSEGAITGGKGHQAAQISLAKGASVSSQSGDAPPLLPLGGRSSANASEREVKQRAMLRSTMWFV